MKVQQILALTLIEICTGMLSLQMMGRKCTDLKQSLLLQISADLSMAKRTMNMTVIQTIMILMITKRRMRID